MHNLIIRFKQLINYEKYKRLIKFIIVGCLNTLVDFGIFSLLKGFLGVNYIVSQVISYSSGTLNSYIFNKFWTFDNANTKKKTFNEMIQFIIVNLLSLGASILGLKILINDYSMDYYLAKVIVIFITQTVNFLGYKFWVFK